MNDQYSFNPTPTPTPPPTQPTSGLCLAALICGIAGFLFNPMYLVSIAALVCGIIALVQHANPRGMALAGTICGGCALVLQFIVDCILSVFTFGASFCI